MRVPLRRLAGSTRWLCTTLRESCGRDPRRILRDALGPLAGGARPLTAFSCAHTRGQHTDERGPVEVDLKRLEGDDDGKEEASNHVIHL